MLRWIALTAAFIGTAAGGAFALVSAHDSAFDADIPMASLSPGSTMAPRVTATSQPAPRPLPEQVIELQTPESTPADQQRPLARIEMPDTKDTADTTSPALSTTRLEQPRRSQYQGNSAAAPMPQARTAYAPVEPIYRANPVQDGFSTWKSGVYR